MVYQDQSPPAGNDTHNDRRTVNIRLIDNCLIENSYFRSSHCTPEDGKALGMQSWEISCHLPHTITHPLTGQPTSVWVGATRSGHCEDREICVDAPGLNAYRQSANVARCVSQEDYVFVNRSTSGTGSHPVVSFAGKRATMMLSESDGKIPREVDMFVIKAEAVGSVEQKKRCRDCIELQTDTLAPNIQLLKTETRLLTTGAVAGILWLALMSG